LGAYQFQFRDLGLAPKQADNGSLAIREELLRLLSEYSKKHDSNRRFLYEIIGKPAVNFLKYAPPKHILYLMVGGGLEAGWSGAPWSPQWLRLNVVLFQVGSLLNVFSGSGAYTFTPAVGLEFEPLPLSSALFQPRLGLRVGYQFSTSGGFTNQTCNANANGEDPTKCSYPVMQIMASLVFYERVRLRIGVEWAPPWFDALPPEEDNWVKLMLSVGWQWISPF
jgi:hypothetical protein